ncbi:MAG TPA: hypothetical protein VF427_15675 [Noviherbaspirillum sp.]
MNVTKALPFGRTSVVDLSVDDVVYLDGNVVLTKDGKFRLTDESAEALNEELRAARDARDAAKYNTK